MARSFSFFLFVVTILLQNVTLAANFNANSGADVGTKPPLLIYDTDVGDDVDDALALALIHGLVSLGAAKLLAITVSKPNFYAAAYCDLVDFFYGDPNVPIGLASAGILTGPGPYVKKIATAQKASGKLLYPRNIIEPAQLPDSTSLLREVLNKQEDNSVVIVQVGYASNMARLLDSPPDVVSPLTGRELVQRKVRFLSVMSGYFGTELEPFAEHNIRIDVPAAQKIFNEWPTPIIVSGWEVGRSIPYPATSIESDFDYVEHHPIREAYELWSEMPYDRPTYDLTSVLYAVWPNRMFFTVSSPGYIHVRDDGVTVFVNDPDGSHHYLMVSDQQKKNILSIFLALVPHKPISMNDQ